MLSSFGCAGAVFSGRRNVAQYARPATFTLSKYVGRPFVGAERLIFVMTVIGHTRG